MEKITAQLLEKIMKLNVPPDALQAVIDEHDPIIRVDRTTPYPESLKIKRIKYPELEWTGPSEFDVRRINQYLHPKQIGGWTIGKEILEELIAKDLLKECFSIADLMAIRVRGFRFFRKHFSKKCVFGWKSVFIENGGDTYAPFLSGSNGGEVYLCKQLLFRDGFDSDYPALLHEGR